MKTDRKEVEKIITEILDEHKTNRKKILSVNDRLNSLGVPYGTLNEIVLKKKSIEEVSLPLLCVFTDSINSVFGGLDPLEYFTATEIREAKESIASEFVSETISLPLTFNAIQIDEKAFSSKISAKLLNKMFESQMIIYDPRSQRGLKYKGNRNEGIIETPIVNQSSVRTIANKLVAKDYLTDTIRFNVYNFELEPVTWIPKEDDFGQLVINRDATISILDGFHRLQATVKAMNEKNDLDFNFELSIRTYDQQTASKFFGQINTINILNKDRKKELSSEGRSASVVKELQTNQDSELKGIRIASATKPNTAVGQLTTFSILNLAIERTFNPQTYLDYQNVSHYLVKYFGILISLYVDAFLENREKYDKSYINHPLMFFGYTVIAYRMYQKDNQNISPKELNKIIDNLDLSNDKILIDLFEAKRAYSSTRIQVDILKHFENLIKEV
ncbi:DNA sulfur modification protein DndB [Paenibacillus polymyxa]|uniref:DGQHR domain-containing protein n=1 Tax=Paenibacillus polymyxa TaxID=1406 RepID=A0ABX2Z8R8_PAEPO|nr:DNA sulfur modification protein DndB [Paenibacillus polymyxa]ODA07646.1 hypothetical protein A7312_28340 [Paenibacillus polymyxa]